MAQLLLLMMMLMNSYIFTQMKHPMSLGLILLIQTILTCLFTGGLSKNFWLSYILFLIFIGGMLILFMYMSSLSPNMMMSFSMNMFIMLMITLTFLSTAPFLDKFFTTNTQNNYDSLTNNKFNLLNNSILMLSKMYNYPNNSITIMMIIYLLLTLIAIVKISNSFMGALRKKN